MYLVDEMKRNEVEDILKKVSRLSSQLFTLGVEKVKLSNLTFSTNKEEGVRYHVFKFKHKEISITSNDVLLMRTNDCRSLFYYRRKDGKIDEWESDIKYLDEVLSILNEAIPKMKEKIKEVKAKNNSL